MIRRWLFCRAVRRWLRLLRRRRSLEREIRTISRSFHLNLELTGERDPVIMAILEDVLAEYRPLDDFLRNAFLSRLTRKMARHAESD